MMLVITIIIGMIMITINIGLIAWHYMLYCDYMCFTTEISWVKQLGARRSGILISFRSTKPSMDPFFVQ